MSKQKAKKVYQPDDVFFKEMMSRKKSVSDYLKNVHPEIAALVDLRTLQRTKESFISPELKTFTSDIIWRCKFKNSEQTTRLAFLWEHKMQEHKNYSIQAGLYIFLFLHRLVNIEKKPIEPILPLLFYNGKNSKWKPPTVRELFKETPGFHIIEKHIPDFEPLFFNLSSKSPEEIRNIEGEFLRAAFFALFSRHNIDLLLQNISAIFEVDEDEFSMRPLYFYIFAVFEKSKVQLEKFVQDLPIKNKIMSAFELMIKEETEKGIQEGFQKGIRKEREKTFKKTIHSIRKMNKESFSIELIVQILDVTPEFVKTVLFGKRKDEEIIEAALNGKFDKNKKI